MDLNKMKQRIEVLWQEVQKLEAEGGGSSGGDYSELSNKPSINNVQLNGDKSGSDLGLASTTSVSTLSNKVDSIFTPSSISIVEGGTFPETSRSLLTNHKPINLNGLVFYFYDENSDVSYSYFAVDNQGDYPKISIATISKSDYSVSFADWAVDTEPTSNSDNFITSGAVYTAIQGAGGGGTDLTPTNVGAKTNNFPEEYMSVLEKHLPFTTGQIVQSYNGTTWFFYAEDSSKYYYIQPLIYGGGTGNGIYYRFATIAKSDRAWSQDSDSSVFNIITTKNIADNAFIGHSNTISSTQNLNSLGAGLWYCPNASNVVNSPTTNPFLIEVQMVKYKSGISNFTFTKQILTDFTTNDVYYRTYNNSTWTSWYKITATIVS